MSTIKYGYSKGALVCVLLDMVTAKDTSVCAIRYGYS